ncbi:MAG TPA: hypothetical protein VFI76_03890, partial [Terrimicrobiaceae bacterium]|nr:hypothetical protein [Terrimicrobiaceae bacterium]
NEMMSGERRDDATGETGSSGGWCLDAGDGQRRVPHSTDSFFRPSDSPLRSALGDSESGRAWRAEYPSSKWKRLVLFNARAWPDACLLFIGLSVGRIILVIEPSRTGGVVVETAGDDAISGQVRVGRRPI